MVDSERENNNAATEKDRWPWSSNETIFGYTIRITMVRRTNVDQIKIDTGNVNRKIKLII